MFVCRNRTSFFSGNEKGRARVVQFLWVLPTIMKTALTHAVMRTAQNGAEANQSELTSRELQRQISLNHIGASHFQLSDEAERIQLRRKKRQEEGLRS